MRFPLGCTPTQNWHAARLRVGAERVNRETGELRLHAGIDLMAPAGTPVFAMDAGHVVALPPFPGKYKCSVQIVHPKPPISGTLLYTEIYPSVNEGDDVKEGDEIGRVAKVFAGPNTMLHLEYYPHILKPTQLLRNPKNCVEGDYCRRKAPGDPAVLLKQFDALLKDLEKCKPKAKGHGA